MASKTAAHKIAQKGAQRVNLIANLDHLSKSSLDDAPAGASVD